MPFVIALAVRCCGLTPAEAITASTANAAAVLGLSDRGTIEPGQRADLILLRHRDERLLAHELGGNPVDWVISGGKRIFLMAPIHHHFEKLGWKESTVVIRFWIIAFVLALVGLATLKLR